MRHNSIILNAIIWYTQASSRGLSVSCDQEEEDVRSDDGRELGSDQEEVCGGGATQPGRGKRGET